MHVLSQEKSNDCSRSFETALEIYSFENNLDIKRGIDKYNTELFEAPTAGRNSIMQLLDSPSDAEIKFRKFIELKQKSKCFFFKTFSKY